MRLLSFALEGRHCLGLRRGDHAIVLQRLSPKIPAEMPALLARGPEYLDELRRLAATAGAESVVPLSAVRLLPPVPRPGKVVCVGLNYAAHAAEGGNKVPEYPAFFLRGPTSLAAHGQALAVPRASPQLDFEAELAFVIGREACHVPEDQALQHVAGYACFNDGSVRDYQRRSTQWTAGKNFDGTGGFGPDLVTADELPPGAHGLRIQARINGEVMQDSTTADLIFGVARLVSILSEFTTLEPGDMVATGTPSGVGYARTPPRFLVPGDTLEIEIEGIGVLRTPIAAPA